jgi:hypothetical protein
MKNFLLYLLSTVLAVGVAYLVNQVPALPEQYKPWVPGAIGLLIVGSAIVMVGQGGGSGAGAGTVIRGNRLSGKRSRIAARDARVEKNQLTGEDSWISTNDRDPGQNP